MPITMPDFLKKESIVPVKKLQDFTFLDRDEFLAENDVDALAKKEAKNNLPFKSAKGMDSNELKFIQQLTQASTAATMTLNSSLADISRGIATIDVEAEKARLEKELEKIAKEVEKVEKKLGNKGFVDRAPAEVVQEHQQRLVDWQQKLEHTRKSLDALGGTAA